MITVQCANCGEDKKVSAYKKSLGQKYFYCNRQCMTEHKKQTKDGYYAAWRMIKKGETTHG